MNDDITALQREIEVLKGQMAGLDLSFAALIGFLNTIGGLPPSFVTAALDSASDTARQQSLDEARRSDELPHAIEHIDRLKTVVGAAAAEQRTPKKPS